jgi:hypothetical protein
MRTALSLLAIAAVAGFGCQPKVLILNVQPSTITAGPAKVRVNWKLSAGTGDLSSDKPVTPALVPKKGVDQEGTLEFEVCETTTFKLEPHYGGERTTTVIVKQKCGAGGCSPQTLTFTGTCFSASEGPTYLTQNVSASVVSGNLKDLVSDADFPIVVTHESEDIHMSAGGGPLSLPLPVVSAAGDYLITIPGAVGQQVCKDAIDPLSGGTAEAPIIHLTVVPACPNP